ncbi:MAG: HAMP domain-containing sensor histidine kinase [bacterium]|nr:HAMP domain-containing sensor histidine kinase [bacterium]
MAIRYRLILWYSGLLAVIIVLFGTILYSVTRWTLINSVDTTLVQTADQVIENSRPFVLPEFGNSSLRLSLPELDFFRASGVVVQVWEVDDGAAELVGRSSNLPDYMQPLNPNLLHHDAASFRPPDTPPQDHLSNVALNGEDWRVLTRPVRVWDERQIVIQTAAPFITVNQATRALLVIMVVSTGVALIGCIALGMGLSNRALAPIETITQTAAGIVAKDDLKTRLPWSGPQDELGRLTSVFNQMMERLEGLFSVQQRFVADVSHELRTPLTAIRGHLDLIRRYGMEETSMEAIESEVERMSRMVNDLLLLAKADFGGLKLEPKVIDLDTLVSEVYREARVLAKDHQLTVTIQDFEPVRINGDSDRLKQLFLNLVSNAIKFTPDGGTITLNLRRTPTHAQIDVADTGIGIAPADQRRIFDRFYQAEPSRVRTKGEGSGLGLSIAKWIVEAHGGTIEVFSEIGMGTTFTVTLPHLEGGSSTPAAAAAVTRPRLSVLRRPPLPPMPKP